MQIRNKLEAFRVEHTKHIAHVRIIYKVCGQREREIAISEVIEYICGGGRAYLPSHQHEVKFIFAVELIQFR